MDLHMKSPRKPIEHLHLAKQLEMFMDKLSVLFIKVCTKTAILSTNDCRKLTKSGQEQPSW